ncbi:hypothetical protein [Thiomicrorhabdus hydrogeniphila]
MKKIRKKIGVLILFGLPFLASASENVNQNYLKEFKKQQSICMSINDMQSRNKCIQKLSGEYRAFVAKNKQQVLQKFHKNKSYEEAIENRERILRDAEGKVPKRW